MQTKGIIKHATIAAIFVYKRSIALLFCLLSAVNLKLRVDFQRVKYKVRHVAIISLKNLIFSYEAKPETNAQIQTKKTRNWSPGEIRRKFSKMKKPTLFRQ